MFEPSLTDDYYENIAIETKIGGSVTYSPMNYCYNTLNDGTEDENLINVVKALYLYAQAADSYFD